MIKEVKVVYVVSNVDTGAIYAVFDSVETAKFHANNLKQQKGVQNITVSGVPFMEFEQIFYCTKCTKFFKKDEIVSAYDEDGYLYYSCPTCNEIVNTFNFTSFLNFCTIELLPSTTIDHNNGRQDNVIVYKDYINIAMNIYEEIQHLDNKEVFFPAIIRLTEGKVVEGVDYSCLIDTLTNCIMDCLRKKNNIDSDSDEDDVIYSTVWNDVRDIIYMW